MDQPQNYRIKSWLNSINNYFRQQQAELQYIINPENHKIDRQYGIIKNFMRLTNKTLIGMKRIRINRSALFSGLLGIFCGYVTAEFDSNLQLVLRSYKRVINAGLIQEVLRNQSIKDKLNENLLINVYCNADIQYKLHEVLMEKAIKPQQKDLLELSKRAVIEALKGRQIIEIGSHQAAKAILQNKQIIAKLTLQFLGGAKMDKILREVTVKQLQGETVNQAAATQTKEWVLKQLMAESNQDSLYEAIRNKFMSW